MKNKIMVQNTFLKWMNRKIIIYVTLAMVEWTIGIGLGSIALKITIYNYEPNKINETIKLLIRIFSLIDIFGSLSLTIIAVEYFNLLSRLVKIRMQNASNYDQQILDSFFISSNGKNGQIDYKQLSNKIILLPIESKKLIQKVKLNKYLNSRNKMWNYCALIFCNNYLIKGSNLVLEPSKLQKYYQEKINCISEEKSC
ncbi:hypothetical protein ACNQ1U_01625 [Mycoplasma sp. 653B]|uniref:hypothetical protein n=1 Tax=Mycoplasma sp. 653B TaxID=3401677 RepID=UPI003AAD205A